jgi:hypothetical protein
MSPGEVENMMTEAIKLERLTLGVEKDRRQFAEIRVFVGTHYHPDEPGYGQEQHFEEWQPNPIGDGDDEDDGGEPRNKALPEGNS